MHVIIGRPKCSSNVELTMTCCTISGRNKVSESRTRLHKEAKKQTVILRSAEFGACRVLVMFSTWQGALQIFQHCDRERWAKRGLGRNVMPMMPIMPIMPVICRKGYLTWEHGEVYVFISKAGGKTSD